MMDDLDSETKRTPATSRGKCTVCGKVVSKGAMLRHLDACLANEETGADQLIRLRVDSRGRPDYWLDIEVPAKAPLSRIDAFLRATWLECCGHLSAFEIGRLRYAVVKDDWENDPSEKTMRVATGRAVAGVEAPFLYEYDYGSTTELRLRVTGSRKGAAKGNDVRLLARNEPPAYECRVCDRPAVSICSMCIWDDTWVVCDDHQKEHGSCDEEYWLPILNSPRTGVCGYGG